MTVTSEEIGKKAKELSEEEFKKDEELAEFGISLYQRDIDIRSFVFNDGEVVAKLNQDFVPVGVTEWAEEEGFRVASVLSTESGLKVSFVRME